jgi:hypothetical protein
MIDPFTKEVEIAATSEATSKMSKKKFQKRIINRKGVPNAVMSDNGRHFDGEFGEYLEELGIKKERSLPYQHNSMGLVERMNRTIEESIRHYTSKNRKDWDTILSDIQFAINTAAARSQKILHFC